VRGFAFRSVAVFAIGLAVLVGILYYATNVDGRAPEVLRIGLTRHLSDDPSTALTNSSLVVDFSEVVDHSSAEAAFRVEPALDGAFSWSGSTMTFTPSERLPLRASFDAHVESGVRDVVGNVMGSPSGRFSFHTVGNPAVVGSQPAPGDTDVPLDASIELTFSTLMDTASVEGALHLSPEIDVTLRWSGEQLTIEPVDPLAEGERYSVGIDTTARDGAGTPLQAAYQLSFETAKSDLAIETTVPADETEGVATTTPIALIFDRELDPTTLSGDLLTIDPAVAGSLEVVSPSGAAALRDPRPRVLQFQPSGPLAPNTTYQVRLAPGLAGADGSRLVGATSWRFTTGAASDTLSNQIVFLSDRAGITNLWAMNPDGSGQHQITSELSAVTDYAVAPDGGSLVVGDGAMLVEMRADGGGQRQLTEEGLLEYDPAYSPDGEMLAFGRADSDTGTGLGLWTRAPGGGDVRQVNLPDEPSPDPTPIPTPGGSDQPLTPLLRAPRFSPDGTALAFVDEAGRVGILELRSQRLTTAAFGALSPPVWLTDSSALLLSGLAAEVPAGPREVAPVLPLDPASAPLTSATLAELRVVRLERGDDHVTTTRFETPATRPAAGAEGRTAYVVVRPGAPPGAGALWLTTARDGPGLALIGDDGPLVVSASFGPAASRLVVGRVVDPREPSDRVPAGIWLIQPATGVREPLAADGLAPTWIP
jgi:hypothetical protein